MDEVNYELKHPFQYAHKGDTQDAGFITIKAPTFKEMDKVTPIKQAFTAAISEITDDIQPDGNQASSGDSELITGAQAMQLMHRWSGDMVKINLHAQQLFKGSAMVDGETPMTMPMIDKMSMVDFEGLMGEYIANFIAPSLMDG
jgi:hypothetical protein